MRAETLLQIASTDAKVRAMEKTQQNIDYCRDLARENDPDRYYISLFIPADKRAAIWALIAFNQEVAKTRAVVSEPMLGEIRLQWWREALESVASGHPRAHPVVEALASEIPDFASLRPYLDRVIDTWSDDFGEDQVSLSTLARHAEGTGGAIGASMLLLLDPAASDADILLAGTCGKIWNLLGTLRALPHEMANPSSDWHMSNEGGDLSVAILPTVQKLLDSIIAEIDQIRPAMARSRKNAALRTLMGLIALAVIDVKAVQRAGDDLQSIDKHLPGNARKLLTLVKYQFLG